MTHPYYPPSLVLVDYQPNQWPMSQLLLVVGSVFSAIVVGTAVVAHRYRGHPATSRNNNSSSSSNSSRNSGALYFSWFLLCGLLHCGFELYWLLHHTTISRRTDILAELWKEYAHGDSRYLISDPLLIALETITVFVWGPLCFVSAWSWWKGSPRYQLYQLIVSIGHLYSCTLYFLLDVPTGFQHCDPHPFYFWIYFVAFNAPWIIIPCTVIYNNGQSILHVLDTSEHHHKQQ